MSDVNPVEQVAMTLRNCSILGRNTTKEHAADAVVTIATVLNSEGYGDAALFLRDAIRANRAKEQGE